MPEEGVSQLVSVRVDESDQLVELQDRRLSHRADVAHRARGPMHRVRIRLLLRAEPARAFVRLLLAGHFARSPGAPVKTCALQHEDLDNTPQAVRLRWADITGLRLAFKKGPVNPAAHWMGRRFRKAPQSPLTAVDHVGTICYAATAFSY